MKNLDSIAGKSESFLFIKTSRPALGPEYLREKRPGRETDRHLHLLPRPVREAAPAFSHLL